jgi:PelA/Pel-15E family pectate lyase
MHNKQGLRFESDARLPDVEQTRARGNGFKRDAAVRTRHFKHRGCVERRTGLRHRKPHACAFSLPMIPPRLLTAWTLVALAGLTVSVRGAVHQPDRATVLATMQRATAFMVDRVAVHGGYVWTYLPDLSRRWGELEATPTMIWMQSGTAAMGEGFLDAFHATGDEYYYTAATQTGAALIAAQHPSGGWNYAYDFAGEDSLRHWYATIGRNAWRLEEFQHFCGNATFDDQTTADSARFLLRLYLEKREARFRAAVDRAIEFVLAAQHPMGGWPQRFPPVDGECPAYARLITLNDRVAVENIDFLIHCHSLLDEPRLAEPIRRAMDAILRLQQPAPQAGWALQYTLDDSKPAAARSYEPAALATTATFVCLEQLLRFHELTGDAKYLAPFPAALAWLDSVRLPARDGGDGRRFPTFVELGTNRPLYLHRTGSNVVNGRYFVDHDPSNLVAHYASIRALEVERLQAAYAQVVERPFQRASESGPFRAAALPRAFPRYQSGPEEVFVERYGDAAAGTSPERIVNSLNAEDYWPTPLRFTSHIYAGDSGCEIASGDFGPSFVGDVTDTSPYRTREPVRGISIATYLRNMKILMRALESGMDE